MYNFSRLVQMGCEPLQEDGQGRTALDVAAAVGNEGILGLFRRDGGGGEVELPHAGGLEALGKWPEGGLARQAEKYVDLSGKVAIK